MDAKRAPKRRKEERGAERRGVLGQIISAHEQLKRKSAKRDAEEEEGDFELLGLSERLFVGDKRNIRPLELSTTLQYVRIDWLVRYIVAGNGNSIYLFRQIPSNFANVFATVSSTSPSSYKF